MIRAGAAILGFGLALVAPAFAAAEDRYASPAGAGPEPCKRAEPCSLTTALSGTGAGAGDRVLLRAGTYLPAASVLVNRALTVEPSPTPARPRIQLGPGIEFRVANAAAVVRGLDFIGPAVNTGTQLVDLNGGTLERAVLIGTGTDYRAARVANDATIRDSVITASGVDARGVVTGGSGALLRNLTVFAGAAAIDVDDAEGGNQAAVIRNTIATGLPDIRVSEGLGGNVTAIVDHSNYDVLTPSGGAAVTETFNQTATPILVNPASGDYRQVPGSPTINAGTSNGSPAPGGLDLARTARLQGPAPDIGAYEYDQVGPDTSISEPPPRTVRTRKTKAAVAIGFVSSEPASAFLCSLDGGPVGPCTSPYIAKVPRGKHALFVFAFDALGNHDSSPAVAKWKVKRQKKKKAPKEPSG